MSCYLRHVGIVVRDIDRALRFYEALLGFSASGRNLESGECLEKVLGLPNVEVTTVKLSDTVGNGLELLQFHSHPDGETKKITDFGATHLALTVENLDELYRKLLSHGIKFHVPPQVSPNGKVKFTFCKDPDGTFLELVEELVEELSKR